MKYSIRFLLALFMLGFVASASAYENQWKTGASLFGTPKYGDNFTHYDHANPDAPKGGILRLGARGGFDSLNPFVVRGRPGAGLNYQGGLLYDQLSAHALDQPSTSYGLISNGFRFADDHSWAIYRIHPQARFHDGRPITPEDVIWSLEALRKAHPLWSQYYRNVATAEKTGPREVTFKFDQKGNRELPHIMGDLPVLPKHWWTAKDSEGNPRDISNPTTEPPLGSGPYKIGKLVLGQKIEWDRVKDYWAADLPLQKGRFNADQIIYTYFQDDTALWEAFKKGDVIDFRTENRSQRWAKSYDFPAAKAGDVLTHEFPQSGSQPFQGIFINVRKEKFSDRRVRQALSMLMDFESMNKNLFFGKYTRTDSFFEGGELQSSGIPSGAELEVLETWRDQLPSELFEKDFVMPDYSKAGSLRQGQRAALKLFLEAGFSFENSKLLDKDGKQFAIEVIDNSPTTERIVNPYFANLKTLGIKTSLRILDSAQYKNRIDNHDFEMTVLGTIQSLSPGNEQREYWSCKAAKNPGARNYSGICEPYIDELIELIIAAPDRQALVHRTHALDRILKWQYYAIPQWHNPFMWAAYWKKLKFLEKQPTEVGFDVYSVWIEEK